LGSGRGSFIPRETLLRSQKTRSYEEVRKKEGAAKKVRPRASLEWTRMNWGRTMKVGKGRNANSTGGYSWRDVTTGGEESEIR